MLTVREKTYETEDISTGSEIYVTVQSADEAAEAYLSLRDMGVFTLDGRRYTSKTVSKITLSEVRGGDIRIIIRLRALVTADFADGVKLSEARAEAEAARAELEDLKTLVAPLISAKTVSTPAVETLTAAFPDLAIKKNEEVI